MYGMVNVGVAYTKTHFLIMHMVIRIAWGSLLGDLVINICFGRKILSTYNHVTISLNNLNF